MLNQLQIKISRAHLATSLSQMKGPKLGPPDGNTCDVKGGHFLTLSGKCLLKFLLCTGAQNWTLNMLNPVPPWRTVLRSPKNLLESRCPFPELKQSNKPALKLSTRAANKGGPQLRLQKSYQFWTPKTSPLRTSLGPACLKTIIFPSCYEVDEQVSNT